jgi:hypothetical protein
MADARALGRLPPRNAPGAAPLSLKRPQPKSPQVAIGRAASAETGVAMGTSVC